MSQTVVRRRFSRSVIRNLLSNTEMVGAVAGVSYPEGWTPIATNGENGVTSSVVAVSTEDGLTRLDWRLNGTPTATGNANIDFGPFLSNIHGLVGESFTLSAYVRLIAGSVPAAGITLELYEVDSFGTYIAGQANQTTIVPTNAPLRNQRFKFVTKLSMPNVTNVGGTIAIHYTSGVAIDVTIGIAIPQLERGSVASAPGKRPVQFPTSVLQPPTGDQAETTAYFARVASAGGAAPTLAQKTAYNNLILTGKTDGWWSKLDVLCPLFTYDAIAARTNMVSSNFNLTIVGTPTFTTLGGYSGTGTSAGYLNTNFNPTTAAGHYTQNAGHIGIWMVIPTLNTVVGGGNLTRLEIGSSGTFGGRINDATSAYGPSTEGHINDHIVINRKASNSIERWLGALKYSLAATATTGMDNAAWTLCGNSAMASYSDARIGAWHVGGALTDDDIRSLRWALRQFIIDIGSTVTYSWISGDFSNVGTFFPPYDRACHLETPAQPWSYLRDGDHHRIELRIGDVTASTGDDATTNRCEIMSDFHWPVNTETWYSCALMFESGGTMVDPWNTITQFHYTDGIGLNGRSQCVGPYFSDTAIRFAILYSLPGSPTTVQSTSQTVNIVPTRGVVHYMVTQFKFALDGTGYYRFWWDGVQLVNLSNINIGYADDPNGPYAKFGHYRGLQQAGSTVVSHWWNFEVAQGVNALQSRIASPLRIYSQGSGVTSPPPPPPPPSPPPPPPATPVISPALPDPNASFTYLNQQWWAQSGNSQGIVFSSPTQHRAYNTPADIWSFDSSRVPPDNRSEIAGKTLIPNGTRVLRSVDILWEPGSANDAAYLTFLQARDTAETNSAPFAFMMQFQSDRMRINLYHTGAYRDIFTDTVAFPRNTWVHFDVDLLISGYNSTTGICKVTRDGVVLPGCNLSGIAIGWNGMGNSWYHKQGVYRGASSGSLATNQAMQFRNLTIINPYSGP